MPIAHSRHTASLIPGAELRIIDEVGHLSLIDRLPTLAAEIMHHDSGHSAAHPG